MSNLLAPVEHSTPIWFKDHSWRWVDIKRFHISGPGTDRDLPDALITHPRYRDTYDSPNSDTLDPIHGPYDLSRVNVDLFVPLTEAGTMALLREWTGKVDYPDGCDVSWPWEVAPPAPNIDGDATIVRDMITRATTRYSLVGLGSDARHEFGWVLGEFLEFALINRTCDELHLVVASRG